MRCESVTDAFVSTLYAAIVLDDCQEMFKTFL